MVKVMTALVAMSLMLSGSLAPQDVEAVEAPIIYQLEGSMGVVSN